MLPVAPAGAVPSDPVWGLHVFGGASAGRTRLIDLIVTPWNGQYSDHAFIGSALSYRFARPTPYLALEAEAGTGYRFSGARTPEAWGALYARYTEFPWNNWLYTTVALNVGLSYVANLPTVEIQSAADHGSSGSRVLHYLGPEVTFARPDFRNLEFVLRWHHRSGVFGLFNGVWGGSNVVTGGVRFRW